MARLGAFVVAMSSRLCGRRTHDGSGERGPRRSISSTATSATWNAHAIVIASRSDGASASDSKGLLPAATAPRLLRADSAHPTHAPTFLGRGVAKSGIHVRNRRNNAERRELRERLGLRAVMAEIVTRGRLRRSVGVEPGA